MRTTMSELFAELNKDITPANSMSTREMDLNKVAEAMDKKLNEVMEKIEGNKQPQKAAEGAETAPENKEDTNNHPEPEKAADEATGGGEEATA